MIRLLRAKRYGQKVSRLAKSEIRAYWMTFPIQERTILFESYSGNGALCHPEAIFKYVINSKDFKNYKFIWVLNDFDRYSETISEFLKDGRVKFVKYLSQDYYKAIYTSKYLINNVSFPTQFVKRSTQVYLNTWHGIPLKKMGYDIKGRSEDAKNIVRNFLSADYLLSSSRAMTEEMYFKAFKLHNIFEGSIIEEGCPRIDRQFSRKETNTEFKNALNSLNILVDNRKIILYAPTWRGESYFNPQNDYSNIRSIIKHIESSIDTTRYRIMVKLHQIVSESISKNKDLKDYIVPNSIATNIVLNSTELLITDYSSIYFDFLVNDKPILFYIPDLSDYKKYRDLYVEAKDLPGDIARTETELANSVQTLLSKENSLNHWQAKRRAAVKKYLPHEDGAATKRIVDIVFNNNRKDYNIIDKPQDSKKRILIYAGGMMPNGITTSALNLLDNINYDKYDITVLCPYSENVKQKYNISQINENARVMFRFGRFNGRYIQNRLRLRVLRKGMNSFGSNFESQRRLWQSEWQRCFGNAQFDHMIDFSGYTAFWGLLFLHGPDCKKSIWLHNDLAADAHRSIDGSKPLKDGLFATFSTYRYFDNLVSVSEGLNEINKSSLTEWAPHTRFTWSSNTINHSKIVEMSGIEKVTGTNEDLAPVSSNWIKSRLMSMRVAAILESRNLEQEELKITENHELESKIPFTFFSAGRLSPEKNQLRLLKAFKIVHTEYPHSRLVIAGDGPLRRDLDNEIEKLGLTESVKLVGHTKNPYALMATSNVFVLSSDYEGQPMVLLEALVIGIPVITTSFGSVRGALPPGVGRVVLPNVEDLAESMMHEILQPSQSINFDASAYNKRAINEFESVIDPIDSFNK